MDVAVLGVMVPIIAMMIPIVWLLTRHRQRITEMQIKATADLSAEKAAQYASHTRELEERVRVLERIVTDSGYNVATQIEALRDARQVEAKVEDGR